MTHTPIRLLALDLDGTILDADGRVPDALKAMLADFVASGGAVTTASGRFVSSQHGFLADCGLGAAAGFPQCIVSVDKLIHCLRDGAYEPLAEWNDPIIARWRGLSERISARMPALRDALRAAGLAHEALYTEEEQREAVWMTLAFEDAPAAEAATHVMMDVLGDIDGLRSERNTRFAGVTMKGTGKGHAVRRVATLLRAPPAAVLAIGDSCNDLTMLDGRFGFRSGAVGNAEPAVKEAVLAAGGVVAEAAGPEGVREVLRQAL